MENLPEFQVDELKSRKKPIGKPTMGIEAPEFFVFFRNPFLGTELGSKPIQSSGKSRLGWPNVIPSGKLH